MKILYYTWNEIIKNDICDAMKAYGHEVKLLSYEIKSYIKDIEFLNIVENELNNGRNCGKPYDFIFSCNFMPVISKIALRNKIPYVSWGHDRILDMFTYEHQIKKMFDVIRKEL